jgi:hypothetical protein
MTPIRELLRLKANTLLLLRNGLIHERDAEKMLEAIELVLIGLEVR